MTKKNGYSKPAVGQRPALPDGAVRPARQQHNNPATMDEFDREHMGIAAKE